MFKGGECALALGISASEALIDIVRNVASKIANVLFFICLIFLFLLNFN
jgi:hypothetical protein